MNLNWEKVPKPLSEAQACVRGSNWGTTLVILFNRPEMTCPALGEIQIASRLGCVATLGSYLFLKMKNVRAERLWGCCDGRWAPEWEC